MQVGGEKSLAANSISIKVVISVIKFKLIF